MYFFVILHSYKNKILVSIASLGILFLPMSYAVEQIQRGDPLKIALSIENQANQQDLLFELDNMDVTRLVSFEKTLAWIHPAALLNQGDHYVKVYRFINDELQLLKQYDFKVTTVQTSTSQNRSPQTKDTEASIDKNIKKSAISIDNSVNASMTLLTSDHDIGTDQRWTLDGSSSINGAWQGDDWALDAQTNLFFDKNNSANNQPFVNLDDYLFKLKKGQMLSQIGHHQAQESSLILQNFNRRGASINWASKSKDKSFTGFTFNSSRISGFRYGLGISNEDRRVIGGVLTLKPFEDYQQTEFAVTWLTGKNKQDYMMLDEQGSAWAVALKSQHLDERLILKTELAHSAFNDGMNGMGMDPSKPKKDKAYRTSMEYKAIQIEEKNNNHSLSFSFDNRYVGTSFYSLANLGIGADLRSHRLATEYKRNSLSLHASIEKQRNNVSDDPMQTTVDSLQLETSIDFSPKNTQAMMTKFWGVPHFSLRLSSAQENSIYLPMGATAMDKQLQSAVLSADFSHKAWDWNARFSYDKLKEETGHVETTHSQSLDISINRQLSDSSQVSLQWQTNKQRALGLSDQTERLLIFSGSTQLLPKKLSANGSLTLVHRDQGWESIDVRASTLEFGLNYNPQSRENKKFKQSLWLKGQYHQQDDKLNAMENRQSYQLSTGFTLTF
jgi:hypothetical protein